MFFKHLFINLSLLIFIITVKKFQAILQFYTFCEGSRYLSLMLGKRCVMHKLFKIYVCIL